MFLVEALTTSGKISEHFETFAEARQRIDSLPAESLLGIPFLFQELADGSQRLVREDEKPLQWHRIPDEAVPTETDAPLPLLDDADELVQRLGPSQICPHEDDWSEDEP